LNLPAVRYGVLAATRLLVTFRDRPRHGSFLPFRGAKDRHAALR